MKIGTDPAADPQRAGYAVIRTDFSRPGLGFELQRADAEQFPV
ncbi:MAG TPA: hypothetical protein VE687_08265 [Stellaceae bacterium]|nr:hypothetical protein [Stellaceae bacterium]